MNPRFLISLVTLLTLSGSLERQELRIKSRVSVPSVSAQIVTGRSRCDPDKNVFLSPGNLGGGMPTTVLKISPDGQKITRYEFGSTPDLGSVVLVEYAIGPDSEVRALVSRQDGTKYLSSFDTAGKYIGSSRIEMSYFTPGLLAVLPAGNVLISGSERAEPGANLPFQPFLGIFNSRGQLVKKVVPQNDLEPPKLSGAAEDRRKLAQHHLSLISGMAETSQQGEVFETYRDGTRACRFSQRRTCKNPAPPASRKWLATAQHRTRRTDPRSGVSGKEAARRYRPRQSANLRQSFRQADQGVLSSEPSNWRLHLLLR